MIRFNYIYCLIIVLVFTLMLFVKKNIIDLAVIVELLPFIVAWLFIPVSTIFFIKKNLWLSNYLAILINFISSLFFIALAVGQFRLNMYLTVATALLAGASPLLLNCLLLVRNLQNKKNSYKH